MRRNWEWERHDKGWMNGWRMENSKIIYIKVLWRKNLQIDFFFLLLLSPIYSSLKTFLFWSVVTKKENHWKELKKKNYKKISFSRMRKHFEKQWNETFLKLVLFFCKQASTACNEVNQFIDVVLTFFVISYSLPFRPYSIF